jgi:energy-coupling factor transport system ATP-binding protein
MTSAPGRGSAAAIDAAGWGWRHAGRCAWAVNRLDLRVEPGERILLLGASGAGKSTLMQALAGVLGGAEEGEEHGSLRVNGVDPRAMRGHAGLLLQDPDSQVILARVGDDVAFGCENLGLPRDEIWRRVSDSLAMVGLDLPLSHPTSALSGGQKQRLALAGVLAMQPGLLLLDEPTANLDPDGVREVRASVARVLDHTEATFIVIEHRVAIWQDLVNRIIVLDPAGGVLADGRPEQVLSAHGERLAAAGVWVPQAVRSVRPSTSQPPEIMRSPEMMMPATAAATAPATDAAGSAVLRAEQLAVARSKGLVVASNIGLAIRPGEVVAVTGRNGAGKSTLALTLAGLLKPAGGRVIAGSALSGRASSSPIEWTSKELLSRIGTVFQDPEHQFVASTVRAELEVGPRVLGLAEAEVAERVDRMLERLSLGQLAEANPFTLSGGEKRRLSVATVLASRPAVLVLDEPTFGQDFRTWQELVALITELAGEGTAIVAVSHDTDFTRAVADREFRLERSVEQRSESRVSI